MPVKDYYQILELEPGASQQQIRQNFRLLAKRYHPDINNNGTHQTAWFREVQEAYDVLTNPAKRENYLHERWLNQSMGRPMDVPVPQSAGRTLADSEQLLADYRSLDHFRFDANAWHLRISQLLSPERTVLLHEPDHQLLRKKVVDNTLMAAEILPWPFWVKLQTKWEQVAIHDKDLLEHIGKMAKARGRDWWWSRH